MKTLLALAFPLVALAIPAVAQQAQPFTIAGLHLGVSAAQVAPAMARYGFLPQVQPRGASQQPPRNRGLREVYRRQDGLAVEIVLDQAQPPRIARLAYRMDPRSAAYDTIRSSVRNRYGNPTVRHGTDNGVRVEIWERPTADQTIDGILTTVLTLTRNPTLGHALSIDQRRIKTTLFAPQGSRLGLPTSQD